MVGLIEHYAILWQCAAVASRPNRDAWAGPAPCCSNRVSRQDRIGFLENFYMEVVYASESDNRWLLEPRWRQDV